MERHVFLNEDPYKEISETLSTTKMILTNDTKFILFMTRCFIYILRFKTLHALIWSWREFKRRNLFTISKWGKEKKNHSCHMHTEAKFSFQRKEERKGFIQAIGIWPKIKSLKDSTITIVIKFYNWASINYCLAYCPDP